MKIFMPLCLLVFLVACNTKVQESPTALEETKKTVEKPVFSLTEANKLVDLPLQCVTQEYPNKPGLTLSGEGDLQTPSQAHPVFYGCFDWHSAVHGYWSLVTLLRQFPEMDRAAEVQQLLAKNLTAENVRQEVAYFEKETSLSFERTYGWAWLLKLSEELRLWEDPMADELVQNLQPLVDLIAQRYKAFLPRLRYPIRVGEHTNTAFGLTFAYDYARVAGDDELLQMISRRARDFYFSDKECPLTWEPSGYDFLSPCFEEVNIMRRVLDADTFLSWLERFLPQLQEKNFEWQVGEVSDRSDGKLVHLDGVNFSRAWGLYALAKQYPRYTHLENLGHIHLQYSYPNLIGDSYEGGHWLGSFAIYALNTLHAAE